MMIIVIKTESDEENDYCEGNKVGKTISTTRKRARSNYNINLTYSFIYVYVRLRYKPLSDRSRSVDVPGAVRVLSIYTVLHRDKSVVREKSVITFV